MSLLLGTAPASPGALAGSSTATATASGFLTTQITLVGAAVASANGNGKVGSILEALQAQIDILNAEVALLMKGASGTLRGGTLR